MRLGKFFHAPPRRVCNYFQREILESMRSVCQIYGNFLRFFNSLDFFIQIPQINAGVVRSTSDVWVVVE